MAFVFIPYKPMENKFHMIIIAKITTHEVCDDNSSH